MKTAFGRVISVLLIGIILTSAVLSGCTVPVRGFPIALSPDERSAFEMCTDIYTDEQLGDIYDSAVETGTAEGLDKKYAIQCLRKDGDNYSVIYVTAKLALHLTYDSNAKLIEKSRKECLRHLVISVAKFDDLKVGDSIHIVQTIDQQSYIPFIAGQDDAPRESDHYTEDGYHVNITYDDQERVSSIKTLVM